MKVLCIILIISLNIIILFTYFVNFVFFVCKKFVTTLKSFTEIIKLIFVYFLFVCSSSTSNNQVTNNSNNSSSALSPLKTQIPRNYMSDISSPLIQVNGDPYLRIFIHFFLFSKFRPYLWRSPFGPFLFTFIKNWIIRIFFRSVFGRKARTCFK